MPSNVSTISKELSFGRVRATRVSDGTMCGFEVAGSEAIPQAIAPAATTARTVRSTNKA
jgi:hypothetical protein